MRVWHTPIRMFVSHFDCCVCLRLESWYPGGATYMRNAPPPLNVRLLLKASDV